MQPNSATDLEGPESGDGFGNGASELPFPKGLGNGSGEIVFEGTRLDFCMQKGGQGVRAIENECRIRWKLDAAKIGYR